MSIITSDRGISLDAPDPWRPRALCAGADPDLFFPPASTLRVETMRRDSIPALLRRPFAYCLECPVRRECLTEAIDHAGQPSGWGRYGTMHGVRGGVFWSDGGKPGDPYGFLAAELRDRKAAGR